MAVSIGTNSGFVTTAPTIDPAGAATTIDDKSQVTHDTSPSGNKKITEIGWWCDTATEEGNFEVGLYAADGGVVPGEAGTLLQVSRTNAKGTTSGWKTVTGLNWSLTASTAYWLGVQLDNNADITRIDSSSSNGTGDDQLDSQTTLPDPFGGGALDDTNGMICIYALVEDEAAGTNTQINIGDSWKAISTMQINIGDSWKAIASAQINIGDAWKSIF